MAVPVAQKLLETAQAKERKLTTNERRLTIAFLMATQPDATNVEMADWFDVTERTVRFDKQHIRQEKARFIKEDDIGLVIADIALDFERQVRDIERSKAKAKLGSPAFLNHCTAAMELRLKMVKAFQDIGYLPKNLGNMTVENYEYKAVVMPDGSVSTRAVGYFDAKNTIEGELVEQKALPEATNGENSTSNELPESIPGISVVTKDEARQVDVAESAPPAG